MISLVGNREYWELKDTLEGLDAFESLEVWSLT